MKIKKFLIILTIYSLFACEKNQSKYVNELSENIIKNDVELFTKFTPEGYSIFDSIKGNLNNDDFDDYILILKKINEEKTSNYNDNKPEKRPLLILTGNHKGELKLKAKNQNIVLCIDCSGAIHGDSYEKVVIKNGYFSIEYYTTGGNEKWSRIITFKYDSVNNNWFLNRDGIEYFSVDNNDNPNAEVIVKTGEEILTPKDFGKVRFEDFDIYKNNESWLGEWISNERFYEARLEITKIEDDSIRFLILASNGGNTGLIDGAAYINNEIATYSYKDEYDSCRIEFNIVEDNLIKVTQKVGNCQAGAGVTYSGDYYNSNSKVIKKEKIKNLVDFGIFKNEIQNNAFKSLVGDNYNSFVDSSQLISEIDDLDDFNAKVYSSGVRGLYTQMENIIMINSSNDIWAAVIDDNKVYYFTNKQDYKNRLPKTIDNWRHRFNDYKVIFMK